MLCRPGDRSFRNVLYYQFLTPCAAKAIARLDSEANELVEDITMNSRLQRCYFTKRVLI
jgi:hypothetical protein